MWCDQADTNHYVPNALLFNMPTQWSKRSRSCVGAVFSPVCQVTLGVLIGVCAGAQFSAADVADSSSALGPDFEGSEESEDLYPWEEAVFRDLAEDEEGENYHDDMFGAGDQSEAIESALYLAYQFNETISSELYSDATSVVLTDVVEGSVLKFTTDPMDSIFSESTDNRYSIFRDEQLSDTALLGLDWLLRKDPWLVQRVWNGEESAIEHLAEVVRLEGPEEAKVFLNIAAAKMNSRGPSAQAPYRPASIVDDPDLDTELYSPSEQDYWPFW